MVSIKKTTFHRPSCLRFPVAFLVWVLLLFCKNAHSQPQSDIESFKNFIANPPIITNFVYVSHDMLRGDPSNFDPNHLGAPRIVEQVYQGCIQPDGFWIREIKNADHTSDRNERSSLLVGRYGSNYWSIDKSGGYDLLNKWTKTTSSQSYYDKVGNPVQQWVRLGYDILNQGLLMGLHYLKAGSIVWHGNEFSGKTLMGDEDVKGTLLINSNKPIAIVFRIARRPYVNLAKYSYDSPAGVSYIPSRVTQFIQSDGGEPTPLNSWSDIKQIDISAIPLSETNFNPSLFYDKAHGTVHTYKDDVAYMQSGSKTIRVSDLRIIRPVGTAGKIVRWLVASLILILSLVWIVTLLKKQKQKKETMKVRF